MILWILIALILLTFGLLKKKFLILVMKKFNQNNPVPMLTETFNIFGAQGNFSKFVCYFILLYVFIYFKLN